MYDIIGDIHGHATPLKRLLSRLGYVEIAGLWRHPSRQVLFLGDYIDRGPEQIEVVRIVRAMVQAGKAIALMGNHEFNAVAWAMPDSTQPGACLRPHSAKNRNQHQVFLEQVGENSELHHEILDWFRTLPLFLDLPDLRAVHACWHPRHVAVLRTYLDDQGRLPEDAWALAARHGNPLFEAVDTMLKGLEIDLPAGAAYHDRYGQVRDRIRTRWWHSGLASYSDLALIPEGARAVLPDSQVAEGLMPGYDNEKPVFIGHYWLRGEPAPLTDNIACLDYSVAARQGGRLAAYRWDGRLPLGADGFVWVPAD